MLNARIFSWPECHTMVLLAEEVCYYLFSEGWRDLVFLGFSELLVH